MSLSGESLSDAMAVGGGGEIMLFGVRVKVDPMRKSVSMNNLSEYEPVSNNTSNRSEKSSKELPKAAAVAAESGGLVSSAAGYASADDAVPPPSSGSGERKRGIPWTEEEHKLFLIGLQKVGKGDWRGISRNYVKTRTPSQVASHAQKYFLRRSNLNRRRRRSSLFDITTDSITTMPVEECSNNQDNPSQPVTQPTSVALPITSNNNVFSVAPIPITIALSSLSKQGWNPMDNSALDQNIHLYNSSPMLVHQVPVRPSSTTADPNLDDAFPLELSPVSLRLSLSTRDSAFQVSSSLGNGDSGVSVA